jgi:hypothetical protein
MAVDVTGDIKAAQRELDSKVLGRQGVSGTAIGQKAGAPCLLVYVSDKKAAAGVPKKVGGFAVRVETTGTFRRL